MDSLITSYFSKVSSKPRNAPSKSRKRRPSKFDMDDEDVEALASTKKRPKADLANKAPSDGQAGTKKGRRLRKQVDEDITETSRASSSTRNQTVAVVDVVEKDEAPRKPLQLSPHKPTTVPSSSTRSRFTPREESVVPATPQHVRRPAALATATPIQIRLKPLSQSYSDETVGSSQSQEDDDAYLDVMNANPELFCTPRKNRVRVAPGDSPDEAEALVSPRVVMSSQSQYLSGTYSSPIPLKLKASSWDESEDFVPSSQTQERELESLSQIQARTGWYGGLSSTPETSRTVPRDSSFSKELPLRSLSLAEDDLEEALVSPFEDVHDDTDRVATSGIEPSHDSSHHSPQSQPANPDLFHPSPHGRPSSSPTFPESQTQSQTQPLTQSQTQSQTQEETPISRAQEESMPYDGLPSQILAFDSMFQGDESYPPDFPQSLRI